MWLQSYKTKRNPTHMGTKRASTKNRKNKSDPCECKVIKLSKILPTWVQTKKKTPKNTKKHPMWVHIKQQIGPHIQPMVRHITLGN